MTSGGIRKNAFKVYHYEPFVKGTLERGAEAIKIKKTNSQTDENQETMAKSTSKKNKRELLADKKKNNVKQALSRGSLHES